MCGRLWIDPRLMNLGRRSLRQLVEPKRADRWCSMRSLIRRWSSIDRLPRKITVKAKCYWTR